MGFSIAVDGFVKRINVFQNTADQVEGVIGFALSVTTNTIGMHMENVRRHALRNVTRSQRTKFKKISESDCKRIWFSSIFNSCFWGKTIPTTIRCHSNKIEYLDKKTIISGMYANRVKRLLRNNSGFRLATDLPQTSTLRRTMRYFEKPENSFRIQRSVVFSWEYANVR